MKHIYLLTLLSLFSFSLMKAESCPDAGATLSGGNQIAFTYPSATSFCANRPITIVVNGTTTFTLTSCTETVSLYDLTSGPAVSGTDFTVTSGFDTQCSYSSGTLPVDEHSFINANFKVYPNPLTSENIIKLSFGLPLTGKVSIYSLTGKQVLKAFVNNQDSKEIDVASLTGGIYMLKVSTETASMTRKVVIMK